MARETKLKQVGAVRMFSVFHSYFSGGPRNQWWIQNFQKGVGQIERFSPLVIVGVALLF